MKTQVVLYAVTVTFEPDDQNDSRFKVPAGAHRPEYWSQLLYARCGPREVDSDPSTVLPELARQVYPTADGTVPELLEQTIPRPITSENTGGVADPDHYQPVGFSIDTTSGGEPALRLIYTIALPQAFTQEARSPLWATAIGPVPGSDGPREGPVTLVQSDPEIRQVVDHWRQKLEESTAAARFLPQYATFEQIRAVYSAVWGKRPSRRGFGGFLDKNDLFRTKPKDQSLPRDKCIDLLARTFIDSEDRPSASSVAIATDLMGAAFGATPDIRDVDETARPFYPHYSHQLRPSPELALLATACTVAYQPTIRKGRGKPPDWYVAPREVTKKLGNFYTIYTPRWL